MTTRKLQPYIYEIDLLRASTAFTVVALHSIFRMIFLVGTTASLPILFLTSHLLHYNREVFVFVTGLVLTYIYASYPSLSTFPVKRFYKGRFFVVFIPYLIFTMLYTVKNEHYAHIINYAGPILRNIVSGNASPQLYYIVLSLQIYLLFPLLLGLIKKAARHPFKTLAVSLAVQLLLLALDFDLLQNNPLATSPVAQFILSYQDMFIVSYQFFLILGGITALHIQEIRAWYVRYGRYTAPLMLAATTIYVAYYAIAVNTLHQPIDIATSALQPSVTLYSIVVIMFMGWVALLWSKKKLLYKPIKAISDMSFGIFFVHFIFLDFIADHFGPAMAAHTPAAVAILIEITATFSLSVLSCYLLLKIPFLSWIIGRPTKPDLKSKLSKVVKPRVLPVAE